MTKLELMMTNNELEARVIELETELKCANDANEKLLDAIADADDVAEDLRETYRELEAEIEREAAERPALPYETWYSMLHPHAGSEPSLQVLAATRGTRIIA